jgi:uncharacterized phage protein (TIGR01671 family)
MKTVKFRIWNGMKMEYNIMAGFLGSFYVQGIDEKDTACMSPFNTKYPETTPLMQFIGLEDKNGKEIYEGDIIKTETEKAMQVSWNKHFASFCLDRKGWMFTHYFGEAVDPTQIEIIGNIYENADLLTA